MSDGTTVKVYAPRIHKSNAQEVFENAEENVNDAVGVLISLASHHPTAEELELLPFRVQELVGELCRESWMAALASNIIDFPEDCEDELE